MAVAVPFPTKDTVDLAPPTAAEVELITRALATGAAGPNGLTDTQRAVLNALTTSMTGFVVDVADVEPLGPDDLADALRFRNHDFRTRIIQLMLLAELLLVPLPPEVTEQVESYAGHPQSAPPLLAQHDFIHVIADYGSTVESEIEVFGLISRANDDPAAFALLAMVLGLFETGYIEAAAQGFFGFDRGHLSADADHMAARLADATYRGAVLATYLDTHDRCAETDLLGNDWFTDAEWPLADVRTHFGLPPRSERAIASGSVTPWEPGGISPFQFAAGQQAAAARDETYDSYGATPR